MSRERVDFETLADWAEGRLAETEARTVEEGLAEADGATRAAAEWLCAFSRASRDVVIDDPPAALRADLGGIFEAYAEGRRQPGPIRRIAATLSSGGGLRPLAGVRSAASQEARGQLIYSTEVVDIALNFRRCPENGKLDLDGQVFPNDDSELDAFGVQILRRAENLQCQANTPPPAGSGNTAGDKEGQCTRV